MLSAKPMEIAQFRLSDADEHLHIITSSGRKLKANPAQLPQPHELTPELTPIPTPTHSDDEDPIQRAQAIRDAVAHRNELLADTVHVDNGLLALPAVAGIPHTVRFAVCCRAMTIRC
jgi:hypothetical protein